MNEELPQFRSLYLSDENFDNAVEKAMKEFDLSKKTVSCELLLFMCMNGDINDFQRAINWFTKNQDQLKEVHHKL